MRQHLINPLERFKRFGARYDGDIHMIESIRDLCKLPPLFKLEVVGSEVVAVLPL